MTTTSPMDQPGRYRPRIVDAELTTSLAAAGAVLIEGPKACGKTATARQIAASEVRLDVDPTARAAAAVDPSLVLDGQTPRLIDEWQLEPAIWNHVRRAVDDRGTAGQFILTGSAVPADDATRHVGAGRIVRLRMRPMTLAEAGRASDTVSLEALLSGEPIRAGILASRSATSRTASLSEDGRATWGLGLPRPSASSVATWRRLPASTSGGLTASGAIPRS